MIKNSSSRLDLFKKLNIENSSYQQKLVNQMIVDYKLDISGFDKTFKHTDYNDLDFLNKLKTNVTCCNSMNELLIRMNKNPNSGSANKKFKEILSANNISISHFKGQSINKGKTLGFKFPLNDYLSNKRKIKSHNLRLRLIQEKILEYKCDICLLTEWNNKPITLQLDHKDGNHFDNSLENLRLLCPACHSKTSTFRGANIGNVFCTEEKLIEIKPKIETIKAKLLQEKVLQSKNINELLQSLNKENNFETRKYVKSLLKRFNIDVSFFNNDESYNKTLSEFVANSNSYHEVLKKLGKTNNYSKLKSDIKKLGISTLHFKRTSSTKKSYTLLDVLSNKHYLPSCRLRRLLIKNNSVASECNDCKIKAIDVTFSNLELDHIDGNKRNNSLNNLRFLCYNCHSQTKTYAGKKRSS